jgi:hypothetical protein
LRRSATKDRRGSTGTVSVELRLTKLANLTMLVFMVDAAGQKDQPLYGVPGPFMS